MDNKSIGFPVCCFHFPCPLLYFFSFRIGCVFTLIFEASYEIEEHHQLRINRKKPLMKIISGLKTVGHLIQSRDHCWQLVISLRRVWKPYARFALFEHTVSVLNGSQHSFCFCSLVCCFQLGDQVVFERRRIEQTIVLFVYKIRI